MRLTPTSLGMMMAVSAMAQQAAPPQSGTRQLPYFKVNPKDQLPPIRKEATTTPLATTPGKKTPAVDRPSPQAVMNLGFRYTLLLVPEGKQPQPVDADRNFRVGDCVALQMESSHSGYLYVLARQSSGVWKPMLPSPYAPEETNVIDPGQKVRVPANYCFEITNPPGTESLTVILSRDPRDIFDLHEAIQEAEGPAAKRRPEVSEMASARIISREVDRMASQFGTRDLVFRKTDKPVTGEDPQYSVAVVTTSEKPVSLVVAKVMVKHQ